MRYVVPTRRLAVLSAEMAASKGPFAGYEQNQDSMLDVMRLHRDAARMIDIGHAPRRTFRGRRRVGLPPATPRPILRPSQGLKRCHGRQ